MNERRVIQIAVGLTVILCVFIIGFSIGRTPDSSALQLISSVPMVESEESASSLSDISLEESNIVLSSDSGEIAPFDLNTATAEQLIALPGIGETIAVRILNYRTKVGAFISVDELLNVNGIGEKKLEEIRPYLYVEE